MPKSSSRTNGENSNESLEATLWAAVDKLREHGRRRVQARYPRANLSEVYPTVRDGIDKVNYKTIYFTLVV
jgi:hypothetical protein